MHRYATLEVFYLRQLIFNQLVCCLLCTRNLQTYLLLGTLYVTQKLQNCCRSNCPFHRRASALTAAYDFTEFAFGVSVLFWAISALNHSTSRLQVTRSSLELLPLPAAHSPPQQHTEIMRALTCSLVANKPNCHGTASGWPQLAPSQVAAPALRAAVRDWNSGGPSSTPSAASEVTAPQHSPLQLLTTAVARHLTAQHSRQVQPARPQGGAPPGGAGPPARSPTCVIPPEPSRCVLLDHRARRTSSQSQDADGDIAL